mmetsp:Transcript_36905/g.108114  ORF Transcript_36905/g.108114 Transcript_36905/m.108114 type:complete len:105 (-) Transcript_36905:256-570(-)
MIATIGFGLIHGKYLPELRFALFHSAALLVPGAKYVLHNKTFPYGGGTTPQNLGIQGTHPHLMVQMPERARSTVFDRALLAMRPPVTYTMFWSLLEFANATSGE